MPVNQPIAIAGIVERYFEPEETRPGRIILRPDQQDETIDLKIWLDRETRAKPNYLINLETTLGDVHNLEGQHIMVSARPSGEYEGRSQYNLASVTIEKQPDATSVEPAVAAPPPAPTPQVVAWGSIDERIAWNSAINNAVTAIPWISNYYNAETDDNEGFYTPNWLSEVDTLAQDIYALIRRGPVAPVEEAVDEADAPDEDQPDEDSSEESEGAEFEA